MKSTPTATKKSSTWRPLFTGDEAVAYHAVIEDIARAVSPQTVASGSMSSAWTLSDGAPGLAMHFASRYALTGETIDRQRALDYLDIAFEAAAGRELAPRFFAGLAGIGWAGQFVQEALGEDDDAVAELDAPLVAWVETDPPAGDYDLIRGVVGLGCYFLARMPRPAAARGLTAVVEFLAAHAEERDGGLAWLTPPHVLGSSSRGISPEGHYDLGLAHGAAGAVSLLGEIVQAGVAVPLATNLLEGATTWILAQERSSGVLRFPNWVDPLGGDDLSARLAWCYGDLGIAAALLNASRRAGGSEREHGALEIARRIAGVTDEEARVVDAGICHGAVGAAHIFNRFHQATGEDVFADAARRWCRRTLELRCPGEGVAGFSAFFPTGSSANPWAPRPGVLNGAAGIGLALAAAVSDVEPRWDRHLLIAIPTQGVPIASTGEPT